MPISPDASGRRDRDQFLHRRISGFKLQDPEIGVEPLLPFELGIERGLVTIFADPLEAAFVRLRRVIE